jgi:hypothetical protein
LRRDVAAMAACIFWRLAALPRWLRPVPLIMQRDGSSG